MKSPAGYLMYFQVKLKDGRWANGATRITLNREMSVEEAVVIAYMSTVDDNIPPHLQPTKPHAYVLVEAHPDPLSVDMQKWNQDTTWSMETRSPNAQYFTLNEDGAVKVTYNKWSKLIDRE